MMDPSALPFASLENDFLRIDYLTSLGPRIIGLYSKKAGLQLFARTPDAHWRTPHGEYYLHGGHRLWTAPEDLSYMCPEDNVHVIVEDHRVSLRSDVDASGLEKEIVMNLEDNRVRLQHRITWHGKEPIELAPWTITQMQLGGMAILPQSAAATGLLPNRNLVLWHYSDLNDERLVLDNDLILVHGQPKGEAFKIGNHNPYGWIGYVLGRALFVKRFPVTGTHAYPDLGCNAEVYVRDVCVEVEALGPLTVLQPSTAMDFAETWEVLVGEYSPTADSARATRQQL